MAQVADAIAQSLSNIEFISQVRYTKCLCLYCLRTIAYRLFISKTRSYRRLQYFIFTVNETFHCSLYATHLSSYTSIIWNVFGSCWDILRLHYMSTLWRKRLGLKETRIMVCNKWSAKLIQHIWVSNTRSKAYFIKHYLILTITLQQVH